MAPQPGSLLLPDFLLVDRIRKSLALVVAKVVVGPVPDTPKQPGPRLPDVLPVLVKTKKGILDEILGQFPATHETEGVKATETILRNLRVLATDQSTSQNTVDGQTVVNGFSTVTLEVTPKIAEKIAVAQTVGTLSLSLRSIADNSTDLERALASGDIAIPDDATPEEEARLLARARNMPSDTGASFVTGADVSRFERRVPQPQNNGGSAPQVAAGPVAVSNGAPAGPPAYSGPVVRVMRGQESTAVTAGKTGTVKPDTAQTSQLRRD